MKSLTLMGTIIFSLFVSGCTASDWIHVAGGVMQGRDDYNKSQRTARLKSANNAAKRINGESCVKKCK